MCFNGAKSWELGWYADKRHVEIDVSTTIRSYSGKLVPILDDPEESGDPMIIKVETGPEEDYLYFSIGLVDSMLTLEKEAIQVWLRKQIRITYPGCKPN